MFNAAATYKHSAAISLHKLETWALPPLLLGLQQEVDGHGEPWNRLPVMWGLQGESPHQISKDDHGVSMSVSFGWERAVTLLIL